MLILDSARSKITVDLCETKVIYPPVYRRCRVVCRTGGFLARRADRQAGLRTNASGSSSGRNCATAKGTSSSDSGRGAIRLSTTAPLGGSEISGWHALYLDRPDVDRNL